MIELQLVISEYGIENLNDAPKTNEKNKVIDFRENNLKWVTSQIDYYNSNFTDTKAWSDFFTIVQHWYYNYLYKKYKSLPLTTSERNQRIQDVSIDIACDFMKTYKRRCNAIKRLRGENIEKSECNYRILKKAPTTNNEQFHAVFQAFIGSLQFYVRGLQLIAEYEQKENLVESDIDLVEHFKNQIIEEF